MNSNLCKDSPCMACTRVKDPRDCEDKLCRRWRNWFLARWESMQARLGVLSETSVQQEDEE